MTKIIISIIISTVSVLTIMYYVKPTYNETKKIAATVTQYDKALAKAKEIQDLRQTLLSEYNLFTEENRQKLKKLLPDDVDNVRLVLDIDSMASARGIQIGSVKLDTAKKNTTVQTGNTIGFIDVETDAKEYETLSLRFSTTATYEAFKLFLQDLEHSLRLVDLIELNISAGETNNNYSSETNDSDTNKESLYKFDIGIKTYWLK